jgi:hypothetical protein
MATSLWNLLSNYRIVIPILQRDYAQGRQTGKVPVIRERFLNALCAAIEVDTIPLELDFIYGYTKENKNGTEKDSFSFVPLDGQQRLTTLFLLHWYVAVKENQLEEAKKLLSKFTYETRHSSRVFCEKLVEYMPDNLAGPVSETIINQSWFFTSWRNDPTIGSMLTMLDAIQNKFNDIENIWPLLTSENPKIVFHLLPMEKLGLPDDLYIKMNSRGKELSEFEHFKSRFSEILSPAKAVIFNNNIDQAWSDLFWDLFKDTEDIDIAKRVDSSFLRFFRYVTDLLIAQQNLTVDDNLDEFVTFHHVYTIETNVDYLFSCLNLFSSTNKSNPGFFDSMFYSEANQFSQEKTRLFFQNASINLFKKCADNYDPTLRTNLFSIGEQLMLYACTVHLTNQTTDFNNRIRKIRNLITNSEDTVRKENMHSLLATVSEIVINNTVDDETKFNKLQVKEEEIKQIFIKQNSINTETVYQLEDHHLLQGCIAIFELDNKLKDFAGSFYQLFTSGCNYDMISRAMLTFGDYTQDWGKYFTQFGVNNNTWRGMFTPSNFKKGFEKTKKILYSLLQYLNQNASVGLDKIIEAYLVEFQNDLGKPKDWGYYFVKYASFRKHEDGFYYWPVESEQYNCIMMRRSTLGGFNWSPFLYNLKEYDTKHLNLDNYGASLVLVKGGDSLKITNLNEGYRITPVDEGSEVLLELVMQQLKVNQNDIFEIMQDPDGMDIEDRIEIGIKMILKILSLDGIN